jgi:hypothetical protein
MLRQFLNLKRHAFSYPPYFASAQLRKINKAEYAYCTVSDARDHHLRDACSA